MASESGEGQTVKGNLDGVRHSIKAKEKVSEMAWEGQPKSVKVTYMKTGVKSKL